MPGAFSRPMTGLYRRKGRTLRPRSLALSSILSSIVDYYAHDPHRPTLPRSFWHDLYYIQVVLKIRPAGGQVQDRETSLH